MTATPKKVRILGKNTKVYLFFVILTSLFLVLTKLSKDYKRVVKFPVIVTDVPVDKVIKSQSIDTVTITLTQSGFSDLVNTFGVKPWLASFTKMKTQERGGYFYSFEQDADLVTDLLFGAVDEVSIFPETFTVSFDTLSRKRVPIILNLTTSYAPGYGATDTLDYKPRSVEIVGPQSLLDTIKNVQSKTIALENVAGKIDEKVALIPPLEGVVIGTDEIAVVQDIGKFTEISFELPITFKGFKSEKTKVFPNFVELLCLVPLDKYEGITSADFQVIVDFSKLEEGKEYLSIEIEEKPESATNVRLSTTKVKVLKID